MARTVSPSYVGGFLYATLASLALGLVISAMRWAIVDQFLYTVTRLATPEIDYSKLKDQHTLTAFQAAIENHYRFYQYYSHSLVAIIAAVAVNVVFGQQRLPLTIWTIVVTVSLILALAARNELGKFNERATNITKRP